MITRIRTIAPAPMYMRPPLRKSLTQPTCVQRSRSVWGHARKGARRMRRAPAFQRSSVPRSVDERQDVPRVGGRAGRVEAEDVDELVAAARPPVLDLAACRRA